MDPDDTFMVLDEINDLTYDDDDDLSNSCEEILDLHSMNELNGIVDLVDEEVGIKTEIQDSKPNKSYNQPRVKMERNQDYFKCEPSSSYEFEGNTEVEINQPKPEQETRVHPYSYIIDTFEYLPEQLTVTEPQVKALNQKICHVVYTRNSLKLSLTELRSVREIALDIYLGKADFEANIAILIISTNDKDYLIDAIKLSSELVMLTEIFINPKILKIIYKAETVLNILQQRLDLYVVNVFDIFEAKRILEPNATPESLTLNEILKTDCKLDRGFLKKPDYSQRPISAKVHKHCRTGTHFLLPLYHYLKNQLIRKDFLGYKKFLQDCRDLTKVISDENFVSKNFLRLEKDLKARHDCEMEVLRELYDWRNEIAQKNHVKCGKVLSQFSLLKLARDLPSDDAHISTLTNSVYIQKDLERVKNLIVEAKIRFKLVNTRKAKAYLSSGILSRKKRKLIDRLSSKSKKRKDNQKKNKKENSKKKRKKELQVSVKDNSSDSFFVSPTNVPSNFTFQNQQTENADLSSQQDNFGETSGNCRKNKRLLNKPQNQTDFESDVYQELNVIDQKIDALERNVQQKRNTFPRHTHFQDGQTSHRNKF